MNKSQIIRDFLKQNPDILNRTAARTIFAQNPDLYISIENTRTLVRTIRGNMGDRSRKWEATVNKEFHKPNGDPAIIGKEYNLNPVDLSVNDFIFPHFKPLILSDIHFPYHYLKAVLIAVEKGIEEGCDSIYLNGDTLDCYQISRFLKEGGMMTFNEEREMFFEFIDYLKDVTNNLPIFFKVGNHEERWQHYILRNAPELQDLGELKLEKMLRLEELGIGYISGRQICRMGKLYVIHGHEFGESVFSPVNPARGLFLKAKSSTLAGHNHQTSEHHENNLKGDSMACFSTGALCQLNPAYRPFAFTKWNHGFAIVTIDKDGSGNFEVDNYRIINGKAR